VVKKREKLKGEKAVAVSEETKKFHIEDPPGKSQAHQEVESPKGPSASKIFRERHQAIVHREASLSSQNAEGKKEDAGNLKRLLIEALRRPFSAIDGKERPSREKRKGGGHFYLRRGED